MKKKIELGMTVILLFTAFILSRKEAISAVESKMAKTVNENCIVIDAGHGGDDPGKIGINGSLEKDINLVIAYKLKSLLESQDYEVVMTRTTADGLYTPGTKNMKVEDMQNRCQIITETMPVFTVSIHQNSYPEEYVKGAQVSFTVSQKRAKSWRTRFRKVWSQGLIQKTTALKKQTKVITCSKKRPLRPSSWNVDS